MLERIDRIQMAVPDISQATSGWTRILGAEKESEDRLRCLGCLRHTYRLGKSRIEFLQPDGTGSVADSVSKRGGHLFSAGVSTTDMNRLAGHLKSQNIEALEETGQLFLSPECTGQFGLRVVVSEEEALPAVGEVDYFYEVTLLIQDSNRRVAQLAEMFALDPSFFVPISSDNYGYDGVLTLFNEGQLHRFEMITPNTPEKTMGRFFDRSGETYYMAFAESSSLRKIEDLVREAGDGHTVTPAGKSPDRLADSLFLHPPVLGGMMLGISRPTMAWSWSGQPDWVEPVD